MEESKDIKFLPKPLINIEKLSYIKQKKEIYVNLFEFSTKSDLKLYKYPFVITPQIDLSATKLLEKIFHKVNIAINEVYGLFTISGNSLYSMRKIEENKIFKSSLHIKGNIDYNIEIQKYSNDILIKKEDIKKNKLTKQFIEIVIKDILKANPNLDYDKGLFILKTDKKRIETDKISINYYPGFITKFIETEKGNFINVSLKNKIESAKNILQYLQDRHYKDKYNQPKILKDLKGRLFYFRKNKFKIDEILFDRNPLNQTIFIDGKNMKISDYYKEKHNIAVNELDQPLILTYKKGPQNKKLNSYYIPEMCNFSGLDENEQKDNIFMKELSNVTKITPEHRVKQTNKFLELLQESSKKKEGELSSKEKLDGFGIQVNFPKEPFYGYLMEEPTLLAGKNMTILLPKDKRFPIYSKTKMLSWLCLYERANYNEAEQLYSGLNKASKDYGIHINEPEWVELGSGYVAKEWINSVEEYLNEDENKYTFVVFLIGKNNKLYDKLKKHSLCENGYVSQVVKASSIKPRGMLSICSKILLQINAKLGGITYKAIMPLTIKDRDMMVIGVDSSHFDKRTAVAMVSTIDNNFANFYNKETIIEEEKADIYKFCVSSFIENESIPAYQKNNEGKKPKNIIIYRQGNSDNILEILKDEIWQIEQVCKKNNILFYYILVNTRTTFKFFEKDYNNNYYNPGAGLLVIDGITHSDKFEFYIQPQQVTGGSATPTKFYVAYGNMDFPEIIPKFTYDLCHIYSNWQGTVRIPNVIKAAEKLSKITVKTTREELNEKLNKGQSYL